MGTQQGTQGVSKENPMDPGGYSCGSQGGRNEYSAEYLPRSARQSMPDGLGGADCTATADLPAVSLAECALCQVHGEWTRCTERSLRPSCPQQGEMPLAVSVLIPEPRPRNCVPMPPAAQRHQMQLARRAAHRARPSNRCARAKRCAIPWSCLAHTWPQGLGVGRNVGEPANGGRAHYEGNGGTF
jgi:hypothetical protein